MSTVLKTVPALLGLAVLLAACGREPPPRPAMVAPDLPVVVVSNAMAATEQQLDGTLEAVNQAAITAQTSGRILVLPVDINARVAAGAVLVRLRDTEQRAHLAQADAGLQAAQTQLADSSKTLQRMQELYQKKLIAAAQLDRATADHDAAQAQVQQAVASRAQAAEQLTYTVVQAPFAGVITARPAQVGEAVNPGLPLLTLQGGGGLRAVVDVPQQLADALRTRPSARVIFADGHAVPASSLTLYPAADPASHSVRVRAELPAATGAQAGQLVKVAFATGTASGLSIPASELAWHGELAGVYVLDGSRLEFRAVRAGRTLADGRIEILAGLSAGDKVLAQPARAAAWIDQQAGAH